MGEGGGRDGREQTMGGTCRESGGTSAPGKDRRGWRNRDMRERGSGESKGKMLWHKRQCRFCWRRGREKGRRDRERDGEERQGESGGETKEDEVKKGREEGRERRRGKCYGK